MTSGVEAVTRPETALDAGVFALDCDREIRRIGLLLKRTLVRFRRRGVVLGLSGGVDSSVCAALAAQALGGERVLGLVMPERESSPESEHRARAVAVQYGIPIVRQDITGALDMLGAYRSRDDAIARLVPGFGPGWKSSIGITGGMEGEFNRFELIVKSPGERIQAMRLPYQEYLAIVAATNYKQRLRKSIEYFHADRMNYAVLGTPNLPEYDLGFFVKNGDGSADLKPIAHLYKTQVYELAQHLGVPEEVRLATPTTDTYSLALGQEQFYFALPYAKLDLALYAVNHAMSPELLAAAIGISVDQAGWIYKDIAAKRRHAEYLHAPPAVFNDGTEP